MRGQIERLDASIGCPKETTPAVENSWQGRPGNLKKLNAFAVAPLQPLGAAGQALRYDRQFKASTVKHHHPFPLSLRLCDMSAQHAVRPMRSTDTALRGTAPRSPPLLRDLRRRDTILEGSQVRYPV